MTLSAQTVRLANVLLVFCMAGCHKSSIPPVDAPRLQGDPASPRSVYGGQIVSDPEALSGVWEADDGHGGAVGIELTLTTFLPKNVVTMKGAPETWEALEAGVFRRSSTKIKLGDESFFFDTPQEGDLRYQDRHLALHLGWADLDLRQSPDGGWCGRFHWKDFDRQVVLKRTNDAVKTKSPFVGTWRRQRQQYDADFSCLHIMQTGTDTFSGWEDLHIIPGLLGYAPQIQRPPGERQTYGRAIVVSSQGANLLRIDSPESQPMCCSYSSTAKLNGSVMQIEPTPAAQGLSAPWDGNNWSKIPEGSCKLIPKLSQKKPLLPCP